MSAPIRETLIAFDGDLGEPDTEWLSIHERYARENGDTWQADVFKWMIGVFQRIIPGADIIERSGGKYVRIGQYRLFEFTVAVEWARCFRADAKRVTFDETYEMVASREIMASMGNFLCQTSYAEELRHLTETQRWTLTVPDDNELKEFTDAYLAYVSEWAEAYRDIAFGERSQAHSRSLGELLDVDESGFMSAAGKVHAVHVLQRLG